MLEAITVLEQAGDHAADSRFYDPIRLGTQQVRPATNPYQFAKDVHTEYGDVMPSEVSILLAKGVNRDLEFVDTGRISKDKAEDELLLKFTLALDVRACRRELYSWHIHINDQRPRTPDTIGSALYVADFHSCLAPKVSAWKFGIQREISPIEPPRSSADALARLVTSLACHADILEEAKKYRAERAELQLKIGELEQQETDLAAIDNRLSEKERDKLRSLPAQIAGVGFIKPSWKRPTQTFKSGPTFKSYTKLQG